MELKRDENRPKQRSITVILRPKYYILIHKYSKEHNIPMNQILNKLVKDFFDNVNQRA